MELHRQGVPKHVCVTEFGDEGRGPGDDLLCALRTRATQARLSLPGHPRLNRRPEVDGYRGRDQ